MRGNTKDIVVIIPIYKNELTALEKQSLNRTLRVLHRYQVVFIKPASFKPEFDRITSLSLEGTMVESFEDKYFESLKGYNKLLLSKDFFKRFLKWKYMLICQLDVYIFRDGLSEWVSKGYDYIGSPWPAEEISNIQAGHLKRKFKHLKNIMRIVNRIFFNKKDYTIGNGGLSLRNIRRSITVLNLFPSYVAKWKSNEDIFWSMLAPIIYPFFNVPNLKQGLGFAFERKPSHFYKMNRNQLPFGVHAWDKHEPEFWKFFIDNIEKGKIVIGTSAGSRRSEEMSANSADLSA